MLPNTPQDLFQLGAIKKPLCNLHQVTEYGTLIGSHTSLISGSSLTSGLMDDSVGTEINVALGVS